MLFALLFAKKSPSLLYSISYPDIMITAVFMAVPEHSYLLRISVLEPFLFPVFMTLYRLLPSQAGQIIVGHENGERHYYQKYDLSNGANNLYTHYFTLPSIANIPNTFLLDGYLQRLVCHDSYGLGLNKYRLQTTPLPVDHVVPFFVLPRTHKLRIHVSWSILLPYLLLLCN